MNFREWLKLDEAGELAEGNWNKRTLVNRIYKHIDPYIHGFFSDSNWQPVQEIQKIFNDLGLNFVITSANYDTTNGTPTSKRWKFEIKFTNQRGKPDVIFGQIIASGAGTMQDPMSKYDLVVTMS